MLTVIANRLGRGHHAAAHPAIQKLRPTYAFVQEESFDAEGFRREPYFASRWSGINCGSNQLAIGSHIIPDPRKPATPRPRCPVLAEFLRRFEIPATTKSPNAA